MLLLSLLALAGWVYLSLMHGDFWQPLIAPESEIPAKWPSVDIIVPARNEAESLPHSLPTLLAQHYPGAWRLLLVDDHSSDGTGDVARQTAAVSGQAARLTVVPAPDLPQGWVGKVAAMQAGVVQSDADYILFTDADIEHPTDSLQKLVARAVQQKLDLTSLMVKLHCVTFAEKLLIPAFVFFFAMLYPFRRVNMERSRVAAAAGGVMLVRRQALENAGGLAAIKSAVIDDCSLAKIIKRNGRIELSLTDNTKSLRLYSSLDDVWKMVARTAFTQMNYSYGALLGTVMGMGLLFVLPVLATLFGSTMLTVLGLAAWVIMTLLYMPTIRFYGLPKYWALSLPLAALIFVGATVDSGRLHRLGKGGQWKGRVAATAAMPVNA